MKNIWIVFSNDIGRNTVCGDQPAQSVFSYECEASFIYLSMFDRT